MAKYPMIEARKRAETGKRAVGRLRSAGRIPAVIYGPHVATESLSVDAEAITDMVESRTKMLEVKLGKKKLPVVIKDVQFDHLGSDIIHVDFEGIDLTETLRLEVPVETHGTPKGVRNGGVMEVTHRHVTVECKPADVPNEITVEVADLDIGDTVTVGDLPVPEGVEIIDEPSTVAVAVHAPRKAIEVEEEVGEEEIAEPEVIGAAKEDEEEESGEK